MSFATVIAALSLCVAEAGTTIRPHDESWRDVKVGEMSFEAISVCELTAELSERSSVPIHLICTSMVDPSVSRFQLPKDATLGQAFDLVLKTVPKLNVRRVGSGLIWNCLGDVAHAKALTVEMDSKAVSGTLDEVMNEVFGIDYNVSESFKIPNSPTNGDVLHVHLRSSGSTLRIDALVVAAEKAEARITLLARIAGDNPAGDVRPTLSCIAESFSSKKTK